MKRTGPSSAVTKKLIAELEAYSRKSKEELWNKIAEHIAKPTRKRVSVNLWQISKKAKKSTGKIIVVPGKVLSFGELEGKFNIAGLSFSGNAMQKIKSAGGNAIYLQELLSKKHKASEILLLK